MGILDDLEAEYNKPSPKPWAHAEDRLEEWLGIVPEGTMKPKEKAPPDPAQLIVDLELANSSTDIYRPTDFKNAVDYARKLQIHKRTIPAGYYAGYIIKFTLGDVVHIRRISEPVRSRAEAFSSPEFTLAITKAIQAIMEFKS